MDRVDPIGRFAGRLPEEFEADSRLKSFVGSLEPAGRGVRTPMIALGFRMGSVTTNILRAIGLAAALGLVAPGLVHAQASAPETRPDSRWNGTSVGIGLGTFFGVLDIDEQGFALCRWGGRDCIDRTTRNATMWGTIGSAVDALRGGSVIIRPGTKIDDPVGRGAAIGAVLGTGYGLSAALRQDCRDAANRPCTKRRRAGIVLAKALWGAALGALVDLAVPTRVR